MTAETGELAGKFCKDADREIIALLKENGGLFRRESYRHEYPYCPRAKDDPLIQLARPAWFIGTSRFKDQLVQNNSGVNWYPEHIRDGRFGKFLEGNVDWALSRERFWGTPLPIWKNDETGAVDCIGSVAEILERNPEAFAPFEAARAAAVAAQADAKTALLREALAREQAAGLAAREARRSSAEHLIATKAHSYGLDSSLLLRVLQNFDRWCTGRSRPASWCSTAAPRKTCCRGTFGARCFECGVHFGIVAMAIAECAVCV